jgi:hypothetical protein
MNSSEWITQRKGKTAKAAPVARKQLPRQVYEFVPIVLIPSSDRNDTITLEESADKFKAYYILEKAGASWGDIEVFDLDEWTDLLEQRQRAPVYIESDNTMNALVEAGILKRAIVPEPEPEPEPEPRCVLRPPCEVCGVYLAHSNPPADFNGRNLCCGWCFKKQGKDHGERCERCEIYTKNTDNTENY